MNEPTRVLEEDRTDVGSYFVANYPPFSVWTTDAVEADARPALASPPRPDVPLGLYLHIPFCRKRCHFCYFRVYTDRNASVVASYLDTLGREWELFGEQAAIAGRPLDFVYFGGGTPSFLSTRQLGGLRPPLPIEHERQAVDDDVEEAAARKPGEARDRREQGGILREQRHGRRSGQITAPSLKIGRYIAMTSPPTSTPRIAMMSGSSSEDRPSTAESTSSS